MKRSHVLTILAAALVMGGSAHGAPLTATQMLQQFNLVTVGDLKSTSHVDGRALIGGNVTGGEFVSHPETTPASNYAGLTVFGSVAGGKVLNKGAVVFGSVSGQNADYNGDSYIGGNATDVKFQGNGWVAGTANNVGFNGGGYAGTLSNTNNNNKLTSLTSTIALNKAAAESTSATQISSLMTGLSSTLSKLKSTETTADGGVSFSADRAKVTFNANAVNGVAVFDLTGYDSELFSSTVASMALNLNGASTVIFNTDDKTLTTSANINFGNANGAKIIWNFAGADSVTVNTTIVGQVLVASGSFTNNNGNVEGGVFAQTVNQFGEIHQQAFTGTIPTAAVPEPETYAMLLAGLGLMGMVARRRRQK